MFLLDDATFIYRFELILAWQFTSEKLQYWLGQNPVALTENQNFTKKKTKKKTGKVELCTVFPNSHFFWLFFQNFNQLNKIQEVLYKNLK